MGFLTPLLRETEPALNLRIGASPSGEGEGGWERTSPIHQNIEDWRVCFPSWLAQSSAQQEAAASKVGRTTKSQQQWS